MQSHAISGVGVHSQHRRGGPGSAWQRDHADLAAACILAAMGSSTKGIEAVGLRVGILGQVVDPADTGGAQALGDIAGQIEQIMRVARRRAEKRPGRRVMPKAVNRARASLGRSAKKASSVGLAPGQPLDDFIHSAIADALIRQNRTEALMAKSVAFNFSGFTPIEV